MWRMRWVAWMGRGTATMRMAVVRATRSVPVGWEAKWMVVPERMEMMPRWDSAWGWRLLRALVMVLVMMVLSDDVLGLPPPLF